MDFDISKLGIPMVIALTCAVIFGSISGYLRKKKEEKEYRQMVGGARTRQRRR